MAATMRFGGGGAAAAAANHPVLPPSAPTSTSNSPSGVRCDCFGRPRYCENCMGRSSQKAARAGTPGFRPPEVLLKLEHQTTAVDMW